MHLPFSPPVPCKKTSLWFSAFTASLFTFGFSQAQQEPKAPTNPPSDQQGGNPPAPPSEGQGQGRFPGGPGGGGFGGNQGFGNRGPRGGGSNEAETFKIEGDKVSLQFPNNTIIDILGIYERLTNKTLIKDTAIFEGQSISLVTPQPVDKAEAVKLIEASLLTNGYAIVADPDGKSARILPTKTPNAATSQFSQGVRFYQSATDLPEAETIVSYFMELSHLDPTQAAQIFGNHVGLNVYGRITPVTTPPGLLITENANIVRQLVKIKGVIDTAAAASSLVTKFIPLKYADAGTVSQIIQATLTAQATESQEKGITTLRGQSNVPAAPDNNQQNRQQNQQQGNNQNNLINGLKPRVTSQVIADARLNQILVVAEPEDYIYIASLIAEFDKVVDVPDAYERKLKNVYSVDVVSVLADLLKETTSGSTQLPGGGTLTQNQQQLISSNSQLLTGRNTANTRGGTFTTSGTTDTGVTSRPDQLIEPEEDNAPVAVLVNKTRIIADPLANSIIVIGPKEDQDKVEMLLEKLDRKPPQVYLSTVIGQLTLGKDYQLGLNYLQKFTPTGRNSGVSSSLITRNDVISNNNISDITTNLITSAIGSARGFNFYGQIGDSVDVFISALESNDNFKVLSRPSVFALNNKKAVITSGQSIPVPDSTITNASSGGGGENGNVTTTVTFKDVVLKLEVIPLINPDGNVTLKIAQVNDTVVGTTVVGQNDVPIIGTEQLTTTVTVPSGNTIVIGGLISEQDKKTREGIPVLSNIPGLGRLFREDTNSKERKELIIFIQPMVVNDDGSMQRASTNEDLRTKIGETASQVFPTKPTPRPVSALDTPPVKKKKWFGIFKKSEPSNKR